MDTQPVASAEREPSGGWWRVDNRIMDEYAAQIGTTALSVYCYLARCADAQGQCWPSQALIAEKLGIGEATVQRVLKRLVAAGLVRIEGRANGMGFQISNRYTLLVAPAPRKASGRSPQADVTPPQADVTGGPILSAPSPHHDGAVPSKRGRSDLRVRDEQDPLEQDSLKPDPPEQDPPQPDPPGGWVPYAVAVKAASEQPSPPRATGGTRWRDRLAQEAGIQNPSVLNEVAITALWLENKGQLADVEAILQQARWHRLGGGWVAQELRRLGRESVEPRRDHRGRRLPPLLPAATPKDEFDDIKRRYGGYLAYGPGPDRTAPTQEETPHA